MIMDDLFSFGEEEEMVLKAQEKEQKKMSEGDGFSLLGEEDMNGFGDFTSDDACCQRSVEIETI